MRGILAALYQPARWLIALIGCGAALAPIRLGPTLSGYWTIGGRILFAALVGWMALSLVGALRHIVELRSDISVADNLRARRRRTRVRILHRIAQFRSEEHTSELQSLMRISYAVFCLKKKKNIISTKNQTHTKQT